MNGLVAAVFISAVVVASPKIAYDYINRELSIFKYALPGDFYLREVARTFCAGVAFAVCVGAGLGYIFGSRDVGNSNFSSCRPAGEDQVICRLKYTDERETSCPGRGGNC